MKESIERETDESESMYAWMILYAAAEGNGAAGKADRLCFIHGDHRLTSKDSSAFMASKW
jgi:hypothetical protein